MRKIKYSTGDLLSEKSKLTFILETKPYVNPKDGRKQRSAMFLCECGNVKEAIVQNVKRGLTTSCGCFQKERASLSNSTHGARQNELRGVWYMMMRRTTDENHKAFPNYGGRGITVCDRWSDPHKGILNFIEDMEPRPEGATLERVNNNLGYSPENCRWANRTDQIINSRQRNDNTSGRRGVYFRKDTKRWMAKISVNGEAVTLGYFDSFEDAVKAREEAEMREYGFVLERYGVPVNE